MLKLVGIPDAEQRYGLGSLIFSGGMRQRCVLAIALACDPEILFADEATTSVGCNRGSKDSGSASREKKQGSVLCSYLMIWSCCKDRRQSCSYVCRKDH